MDVPVSTISSLSAGEFVDLVAANLDEIISLKTFHAMIMNDHENLKKEKESLIPMPAIRDIDQKGIYSTYKIIKQDVQDIVESIMAEILNNPGRRRLLVKKG